MRKGKFKIITASVLLGLMFSVSILSGCSLVTTDYSQYYKAIVASATTENGKKIEITKKDLLMAYSSYGYQYSSYYGMSTEEAIKTTLEQLVSNELVVDKVERYLKSKNGGEVLTKKEKKYLWEKTYDSLLNNLKDYANADAEDEEEEEEATLTKRTYEKAAELLIDNEKDAEGTGKYSIKKRETVKTEIEKYVFWSSGYKDATKDSDKEELYTMLGDFVVANKEYSKAYSSYLSSLKKGEEGQKLSTANKDVLMREIDRLYNVNYDSYMATKYEEIFKSTDTNVTIDDVLSLYKSYVLEDYTKYGLEKSSTYSDDILSSADGMYYVPSGSAEFFYVTHILIKFTDEQTALLETYEEVLEGNGSGEYTIKQAKQGIEDLYNGLLALVRTADDQGVYTEDATQSKKEVTAQEVLDDVIGATSTNNVYKKAENFSDLMYKYTEDDGTLGATYNYVIGVDYSTPTTNDDGEVTKNYTAHSQMVENFTTAAIDLYNHGNGQIGDVSGLVRTEYGLHILMYGGKLTNICEDISLKMELAENEIDALYETRLNPCFDYTYFDLLYDNLVADNFSEYQEQDINLMKSKLKDYNFYHNAYKDLL